MNPRRHGIILSLFIVFLVIAAVVSGAIVFSAGTANKSYLKSLAAAESSNFIIPQNIVSTSTARIAFVKPTFTRAAYANSFYVFYNRHIQVPKGKAITTDLPFLTAQIDPKAEQSSSPRFLSLVNNVETLLPNSKIQVMTDEEADAGAIFERQPKNNDNHTVNAFDILILGHQEYVTQREYNNFKQFVQSGGKIIFLDGNVFFAEVKYDRANSTITLVKGHGWEFDGKAAQVSVGERWRNETAQWVGSNYLCYLCTITFANNPFGYTHHEEQYLSNPKDVILLNYHASSDPTHTIATYELNYGKGKSVVVGLYSDDIIHNEKFIGFFDHLLLRQLR
jgi:hypothetical protein